MYTIVLEFVTAQVTPAPCAVEYILSLLSFLALPFTAVY